MFHTFSPIPLSYFSFPPYSPPILAQPSVDRNKLGFTITGSLLGILVGLFIIVIILIVIILCCLQRKDKDIQGQLWNDVKATLQMLQVALQSRNVQGAVQQNRVQTDSTSNAPIDHGFTEKSAKKYVEVIKRSIKFGKTDSVIVYHMQDITVSEENVGEASTSESEDTEKIETEV